MVGHVGLTPQTATALGGYRVQGRSAETAFQVVDGLLALQDAGCFCVVMEAVPHSVTELVMPLTTVPVIGIGAGASTDGQVLVFHDLLGIREGKGAKFVRRYAGLLEVMSAGVAAYAQEVREGAFPAPEHTYAVDDAVLDRVREHLAGGPGQ